MDISDILKFYYFSNRYFWHITISEIISLELIFKMRILSKIYVHFPFWLILQNFLPERYFPYVHWLFDFLILWSVYSWQFYIFLLRWWLFPHWFGNYLYIKDINSFWYMLHIILKTCHVKFKFYIKSIILFLYSVCFYDLLTQPFYIYQYDKKYLVILFFYKDVLSCFILVSLWFNFCICFIFWNLFCHKKCIRTPTLIFFNK